MKKPLSPTIQPTTPFRSAYSPPIRHSITFAPQGRTKQSFKDECDINVIMSRYQETGHLPDNLNPTQPQFLDATGFDFDLAMNLVAEATSAFEELPSSIRARFHHDPGEFLDFASNPENRAAMAEMGLLKPEPEWAKGTPAPTPPKSQQPASIPLQSDSGSTSGLPVSTPGAKEVSS